jgi:hypothetical protein
MKGLVAEASPPKLEISTTTTPPTKTPFYTLNSKIPQHFCS